MAKESSKAALLAHLESQSHIVPGAQIEALDDHTLQAVVDYVDKALEHERAGMDGLFQSMSQTMKYIPRFLLQSLAQKFIEPPVAARITTHLTLKQAAGIASGLPADYVAESAVYLDVDFAAEFLTALPPKQRPTIMRVLLEVYPEDGIAILGALEKKARTAMKWQTLLPVDIEEALSPRRLALLKQLASGG